MKSFSTTSDECLKISQAYIFFFLLAVDFYYLYLSEILKLLF